MRKIFCYFLPWFLLKITKGIRQGYNSHCDYWDSNAIDACFTLFLLIIVSFLLTLAIGVTYLWAFSTVQGNGGSLFMYSSFSHLTFFISFTIWRLIVVQYHKFLEEQSKILDTLSSNDSQWHD